MNQWTEEMIKDKLDLTFTRIVNLSNLSFVETIPVSARYVPYFLSPASMPKRKKAKAK
jgi:hypothetical protein